MTITGKHRKQPGSYHPDFGGVGDSPMLLEHPVVVGEQQFEAEAQGEDEGEP